MHLVRVIGFLASGVRSRSAVCGRWRSHGPVFIRRRACLRAIAPGGVRSYRGSTLWFPDDGSGLGRSNAAGGQSLRKRGNARRARGDSFQGSLSRRLSTASRTLPRWSRPMTQPGPWATPMLRGRESIRPPTRSQTRCPSEARMPPAGCSSTGSYGRSISPTSRSSVSTPPPGRWWPRYRSGSTAVGWWRVTGCCGLSGTIRPS